MKTKELLEKAIDHLIGIEGCPTVEKFIQVNPDCPNCNDDQNLETCWMNFFKWKIKNEN